MAKKTTSKKESKKKAVVSERELNSEINAVEKALYRVEAQNPVNVKASKPISKIVKGNIVKIDGIAYEVDAHYVLIDHGTTKEMTIELFNPKTDKDYQLRYFNDQVESTLEFYELQEILYLRREFKKIEW